MSSAVDAATVDATSVQLLGPEGNVIPTVATASGTGIQLTPRGGLLPGGTKYTATLSTAVKSTTGQNLAAAASVPFTTAEQQWGQQATFLGEPCQKRAGYRSCK